MCAGAAATEVVLKHNPQVDNEGEALGQAVTSGLRGNT